MHTRTARVLLALLLGAPLACKGPDLTADIDEYLELTNQARQLACNCPEELFYGTTEECLDGVGSVGESEAQCMEDAFDSDRDAGEAYLTCANTALSDYQECLAANSECVEGGYDACAMELVSSSNVCGSLLDTGTRSDFAGCGV